MPESTALWPVGGGDIFVSLYFCTFDIVLVFLYVEYSICVFVMESTAMWPVGGWKWYLLTVEDDLALCPIEIWQVHGHQHYRGHGGGGACSWQNVFGERGQGWTSRQYCITCRCPNFLGNVETCGNFFGDSNPICRYCTWLGEGHSQLLCFKARSCQYDSHPG